MADLPFSPPPPIRYWTAWFINEDVVIFLQVFPRDPLLDFERAAAILEQLRHRLEDVHPDQLPTDFFLVRSSGWTGPPAPAPPDPEPPAPPPPPAVRFDAPVGTAGERAGTTLWPGSWKDVNPYLKKYSLGYHTGADLNLNLPGHWDADRLAPVFAVADGLVTWAGLLRGTWGNVVVLEHMLETGKKVYSRYGHLDGILAPVAKGATVLRGESLGNIGRPPPAGAYHLHFDISLTEVLLTNPGDWPGLDLERVKRDYTDPKAFIAARHRVAA